MILLPIVISLIIVVFLLWKRDTIKPMEIVFMGAIIVVIGGLVGALGTFLNNQSSSAKTDRIESGVNSASEEVKKVQKQNQSLKLSSEILTEKVDDQAQTIEALRKENILLSSKLTSESLKIYNNLMGAGGCPIVNILPLNSDSASYWIRNKGETPLYDVSLYIRDSDVFRKSKVSLKDLNASTINLEIGTMIKDDVTGGILTGDFTSNTKLFDIQIRTRSGYYSEKLLLMKMGGVWKSEVTIYDAKKKILYEFKRDYNFESF